MSDVKKNVEAMTTNEDIFTIVVSYHAGGEPEPFLIVGGQSSSSVATIINTVRGEEATKLIKELMGKSSVEGIVLSSIIEKKAKERINGTNATDAE